MTTTTPAAYLYALPGPVQERLVALVRSIARMDGDEKVTALTAMTGCAEALFDHVLATGASAEPLDFMAAVGEVVKAMNLEAIPESEVA